MEYTWTVPVAAILGGIVYSIFARYFTHKERLASTADAAPLDDLTARVHALESQLASASSSIRER